MKEQEGALRLPSKRLSEHGVHRYLSLVLFGTYVSKPLLLAHIKLTLDKLSSPYVSVLVPLDWRKGGRIY